jgi:hypothetical protein
MVGRGEMSFAIASLWIALVEYEEIHTVYRVVYCETEASEPRARSRVPASCSSSSSSASCLRLRPCFPPDDKVRFASSIGRWVERRESIATVIRIPRSGDRSHGGCTTMRVQHYSHTISGSLVETMAQASFSRCFLEYVYPGTEWRANGLPSHRAESDSIAGLVRDSAAQQCQPHRPPPSTGRKPWRQYTAQKLLSSFAQTFQFLVA